MDFIVKFLHMHIMCFYFLFFNSCIQWLLFKNSFLRHFTLLIRLTSLIEYYPVPTYTLDFHNSKCVEEFLLFKWWSYV